MLDMLFLLWFQLRGMDDDRNRGTAADWTPSCLGSAQEDQVRQEGLTITQLAFPLVAHD